MPCAQSRPPAEQQRDHGAATATITLTGASSRPSSRSAAPRRSGWPGLGTGGRWPRPRLPRARPWSGLPQPRGRRPASTGHHTLVRAPPRTIVVDDVRHLVGGRVRGAQAGGAHGVREDELPAEAHHARHAVITPIRTAARPIPLPACGTGPPRARPAGWSPVLARRSAAARSGPPGRADRPPPGPRPPPRLTGRPSARPRGPAAGLRPSMSSQRSGGRALDDLGEADDLAGRGEARDPGQERDPAGRGRLAAAAAPSMAPSALAPASPSIARSPRSSPSSASAAPSGIAPARPAGQATGARTGPAGRGAPVPGACRGGEQPARQGPTLIARPGRRSNRFSRLAPPAISPR